MNSRSGLYLLTKKLHPILFFVTACARCQPHLVQFSCTVLCVLLGVRFAGNEGHASLLEKNLKIASGCFLQRAR